LIKFSASFKRVKGINPMKKKLGLIGCGIMGQKIAKILLDHNYEIAVFDTSEKAISTANKLGCKSYPSPAAIALETSLILISLPTPAHVEMTVCKEDTGLLSSTRPGSIIVDMSTVDPITTQQIALKANNKNVGYIDAPVLGRPASIGKWTLPIGGAKEDITKAEPVLKILAEKIVHLGPVGSGNKLKLLNNLMFGAINSITCEVFALCNHLGLDTNLFFNTISESNAGTVSNLFKELGPKIVNQEFSANFSINNLYKDIQLGIDMAKKSGAYLPISENNQTFNALGKDSKIRHEDTAALIKIFEKLIISKDQK